MNEATPGQAIWRGATKRCARCGERRLFRRWLTMLDRCPRCGHRFERTDGFWLGSIMINMAFTFALFIVAFVGGMVLTWPDPPWTALLVGMLVLNALFPVLFHPVSRTLWIGIEMAVRPLEAKEIADAIGYGTGEWSIAGMQPERQSGN